MDFSRWTVKALSAELDSRGLPKGGKKEELVMRLEKDEKKKSRKRKEPERASAEEEVLASLVCPVCFSRMMPPFSQCANGHVLCNECKPNIVKQDNKCPTCRVSLHNSLSRNLIMEKLVGGLTVPCANGCGEAHLPYSSSREHELRTCRAAPIACPFLKIKTSSSASLGMEANCACDFKAASVEELREHMKTAHRAKVSSLRYQNVSKKDLKTASLWKPDLMSVGSGEQRFDFSVQVWRYPSGVLVIPTLLTPNVPMPTYKITAKPSDGSGLFIREGKVRGPREVSIGEDALARYLAFPATAFVETNDETVVGGKKWKLNLKFEFTEGEDDDEDQDEDDGDEDDDEDD